MKYAQKNLTILFCFFSFVGFCQNTIYLDNPSFEDMPRHSRQPVGWYDCGFPNESPPDTQPGFFDVNKQAYEGHTYLGMTVRSNGTWESVAQRMSEPMLAGQCYNFSIFLSRSELYISGSKDSMHPVNYTTPATIRIWGGGGYCKKVELLYVSDLIVHNEWERYDIHFSPTLNHHEYLLIEAYYKVPTAFPYNGNVLIDHASPISPVDCDSSRVFVLRDSTHLEDVQFEEDEPYIVPAPSNNNTVYRNSNREKIDQFIHDFWNQTLFKFEDAQMTLGTEEILLELIEILKADPYLRTEIIVVKGKGNLGRERVQTIKEFLRENGLHKGQAYVAQVGKYDLGKDWDGKSLHMWIYYEHRRKPVQYNQIASSPKKQNESISIKPAPKPPKFKQAENLIELETLCKKNGKKMKFEEGEDLLTQEGMWALEELVMNMKRFPKYKLWIAVDGDMEFEKTGMTGSLRELIKEQGLPQKQFRVRYLEAGDEEAKWLGKNEFLKLKLEKI